MKYIIWILLIIIVAQGVFINKLKNQKPTIIVIEQEDDFLKNLPIVPKETIKGLD